MVKTDGSRALHYLSLVPGSRRATVDLLLGAIAVTAQLCAQEAGDVAPEYEARIHDRIQAELPNIVDSAMDMAFNVSETGARFPKLYRTLSDNNMDPIAAMTLRQGRKFHGGI